MTPWGGRRIRNVINIGIPPMPKGLDRDRAFSSKTNMGRMRGEIDGIAEMPVDSALVAVITSAPVLLVGGPGAVIAGLGPAIHVT